MAKSQSCKFILFVSYLKIVYLESTFTFQTTNHIENMFKPCNITITTHDYYNIHSPQSNKLKFPCKPPYLIQLSFLVHNLGYTIFITQIDKTIMQKPTDTDT